MVVRRRARASSARASEQIPPEAEMEILALLGRHGDLEARQIRSLLHPFRPMTHASVVTLLGRLEKKGMVARRKAPAGKSFIYSATRAAKPVYRTLITRIVRRIFADDPASLVASLFEARPPDARELDEIRDLLNAMQAKKKR